MKNTTTRKTFVQVLSMGYVLLLMLQVVLFSNRGYVNIYDLKYRYFRTITIVYLLVIWLYIAQCKLIGCTALQKRSRGKPKVDWIVFCFLGYLCCSVISALLSKYPNVFVGSFRFDGVLTILLYVLLFFTMREFFCPRAWMVYIWGGIMVSVCTVGIIQLLGYNPFGLFPDPYTYYDAGIYYSGQYWSTIGNTDLAGVVLSGSVILLTAFFVCRESKWDWVLMLPLALCVASVLSIAVAAALLSTAVGLLILPLVLVKHQKQFVRFLYALAIMLFAAALVKLFQILVPCGFTLLGIGMALQKWKWGSSIKAAWWRRGFLASVVFGLVGAFLYVYLVDDHPVLFLEEAHKLLQGEISDEFGSGRIYIWKQVLQKIAEKPLFGSGPDTLGYRQLEPFTRYSSEVGKLILGTIDAAHNEYLNIAVNQGVLALLIYLCGLTGTIIVWIRNKEDLIVRICGLVMIAYLVYAFFGISSCCTTPYLWTALAVINRNSEKEKET